MPRHINSSVALAAIGGRDAGAAELEQPLAGMTRDERSDVEFAGAVEAEVRLRDVVAQQPIGADYRRRAVDRAARRCRRRSDGRRRGRSGRRRGGSAARSGRPWRRLPRRTRDSAASGRGGFPSSSSPGGRRARRSRRASWASPADRAPDDGGTPAGRARAGQGLAKTHRHECPRFEPLESPSDHSYRTDL